MYISRLSTSGQNEVTLILTHELYYNVFVTKNSVTTLVLSCK